MSLKGLKCYLFNIEKVQEVIDPSENVQENGRPTIQGPMVTASIAHGSNVSSLLRNATVAATGGGLTDSDYQEGSYEEEDLEERGRNEVRINENKEDSSDREEEPEEEGDDNENEINDADLLRSMLQESEFYYANLAASQAAEEKHCWVCFASEEDDPMAIWTHPCK